MEYLRNKLRVLCIAPYDGLVEIMEKVSGNYPDLDITCRKGDLVDGLKLAENASSEGFDIIVSRGGTYELIKKSVDIPVVNIELSGYDFIRALKLIKSYTGKSAVVGFPFIAKGAESVNEIMGTGLEVIQINGEDEVEPLLKDLRNRGYNLIIGDAVTDRTARRLGMNGMLLTSGEESVAKAYEEVINICSITGKYKKENQLLDEVLRGNPNSLFITENSSLVFSNLDDEIMAEVFNTAVASLDRADDQGYSTLIAEGERFRCSILGKSIRTYDNRSIAAFYIKEISGPDRKRIKGLVVRNPDSGSASVPSLFRNRAVDGSELLLKVREYSKTRLPILIDGEPGVGKEVLAYWIYRNSRDSAMPFITVDFAIAGEADAAILNDNWDEIIPIGQGATIFLKNIGKMSIPAQRSILDLLKRNEIAKNFRIISSTTENLSLSAEKGGFLPELYYALSKLRIHVPSLEESKEELGNLCSLYIIEANAKFGKQIIGIDEDALDLLKQMKFVFNFEELKTEIYELVLSSQTRSIRRAEVENALKHANTYNSFDAGTLEELEIRAIRSTLARENGNQVKAAVALGISRSTLWRKMKQYGIT